MNNFVYDIPTKVYFGENQLGLLGEELSKYGKKVLLADVYKRQLVRVATHN